MNAVACQSAVRQRSSQSMPAPSHRHRRGTVGIVTVDETSASTKATTRSIPARRDRFRWKRIGLLRPESTPRGSRSLSPYLYSFLGRGPRRPPHPGFG